MKKPFFALCATMIIMSCDKLKDLVNVNFNFSNGTTEFTIPASPAGSYGSLTSETFYMNIDSLIKANNAESSLKYLKTMKINSIDLTLSDPDSTNNFANLESCKMKFSTNVKPDTLEIGSLTSNPDIYKSMVSIPVNTTIDVKEYAQNASVFKYSLQATLRRATTKPLKCKVKVNYQITCGL